MLEHPRGGGTAILTSRVQPGQLPLHKGWGCSWGASEDGLDLASTQIPRFLAASTAWMGGWLLHCPHDHAVGLGAASEGSRKLFPPFQAPSPLF